MDEKEIIWIDIPDCSILELSNEKKLRNKKTGTFYKIRSNGTTLVKYNNKFHHMNVFKLYESLFEKTTWEEIPECPSCQMNDKMIIRNKRDLTIIEDYTETGGVRLFYNGKKHQTNRIFIYERLFLPKEQWKYYNEIELLKNKYPQWSSQINDAYDVYPYVRDSLLIIVAPELIEEWSVNNEISLGKVLYSGENPRKWKCKNIAHKEYTSYTYGKIYCGVTCVDCTTEKLLNSNPNLVGDETEDWFENELIRLDLKAEKQINNNSIADILIDINSKQYALQCKTLTLKGKQYRIHKSESDYPDNLIIVAANREKDTFIISTHKEIKLLGKTSVWIKDEMLIKSKELLFSILLKEITNSVIVENIEDYLSPSEIKEYRMKKRLKKKVEELGLIYEKHKTNHDTIDCIINKIPCQLKYSSNQLVNTFHVGIHKYANKKRIPYDINDKFKIFIVELSESEGNFLLMTFDDLVKLGYITTDDNKGKTCIMIPSLNNNKHSLYKYWNNFDILK